MCRLQVPSVTTDYVYIGGTDAANEGQWEWTDGSALDFEYWLSGQPDSGTDQNLLGMDKSEGSILIRSDQMFTVLLF